MLPQDSVLMKESTLLTSLIEIYRGLIGKEKVSIRTYSNCVPRISIPDTNLFLQMNPTGDTKKEAQRISGRIGSLFSNKTGAVPHFTDIISETSDINGDTKTNAQRVSGYFGSPFSRKPEAVAYFADIISEPSDVNAPGPYWNTASKPETANTETRPEQLTTEVQTIEIDTDDVTDSSPTTSRQRINDPNNPYAYQCNLSQEKLEKLSNDDNEVMDDDSLKAFLNILRIESRKPVIVVSSHYRKRVPRLGLTKSLYDGDLENFEMAIIPIHMPSTEAAHWVLGIYRRNESILYFDSLGITYGMVKSKEGMTLELVTDWVSEILKSAVRDITRDNHVDPKIEAVPLDGPQFDHYCTKYRINPQLDGVNCGFHIALIAEAFLMNNGEVFLENFDIAAERTRILNILYGLRNDNYRYIPRGAHNTPKDVDVDLEIQQSDNAMNASEKFSDFCKNSTMVEKSVAKSVTIKHGKAPFEVTEKTNQLAENTEAFALENDWPKATNEGQSPGSVTIRDEARSNPAEEIEVNHDQLPMATGQQPILLKGIKVLKKPNPEDNAQPKTNIQPENVRRDETEEDNNERENEEPKSNNELSAENEPLRKKVQKLEENLAQFQEQLKQLQFEKDQLCNTTSQNMALESAQPESEQNHNALAIDQTLSVTVPVPTDNPALTTTDNGNTRLSEQNDVQTAVVSNASNDITILTTPIRTESSPLKRANVPNKQGGSRALKPPIVPQDSLLDDEIPLRLRLRRRFELENGMKETLTNKIRANDSEKKNHRETNGNKVHGNPRPTARLELNKKHQHNIGRKRAVDNEKRHKCKQCRYATNLKCNLTMHVRTHTGERPFKCKICSYAAAQQSALIAHQRIHTGNRPFKCKQCNYSVAHRHVRHERTHTEEKPYRCRFCQYASNQNGNFKQHMRTQHKGALTVHAANSKNNTAARNMLKQSRKKN